MRESYTTVTKGEKKLRKSHFSKILHLDQIQYYDQSKDAEDGFHQHPNACTVLNWKMLGMYMFYSVTNS